VENKPLYRAHVVEGYSSEGLGIAPRTAGKVVFVPGAVRGESVRRFG
jgi:predicted RNA-binding protein with TRAM domain